MKVSVRNLGVIKEAEIDLKPFTVFIGPNNAGKTWLAYTLGAIVGEYGQEKYLSAYLKQEVATTYLPLDRAIEQVLNEGITKIDLVQFADEFGEIYFNDIAHHLPNWLQEYLDTDRSFKKLEAKINLDDIKEHFLGRVLEYPIERKISFGSGRNPGASLLTVLKETGKRELLAYTSAEGATILTKLPLQAIKDALASSVFSTLHFGLYTYVNIFVAERTALTTYPIFQSMDKRQPGLFVSHLPKPVDHFKNMIEVAYQSTITNRQKDVRRTPAIETFIQLAQLLENQVLGGGVDFSTPKPDSRREILFHPEGVPQMELPIASSMVKELASLVLYLRYLALPGDWLIIDEPEINLHPEAQAQLAEFLVMLVKADLSVLLTTHSPYIVDHLTNLMKAAESGDPDAIQEKFYLKNKDAFIAKDNVSVYLVDQGKTENMLDEDGVVHWSTFGKVSDQVSEIFFEL